MNQMPARMNSTSGASLPIVSALTTHDDCLMPRMLIHVRITVSVGDEQRALRSRQREARRDRVLLAEHGPIERERERQAVG